MKLSSETMITNQIKCHGSIQTTLEDDVNVPDTKSDIDLIIKQNGCLDLTEIKCEQNKCVLRGSLQFELLYASHDDIRPVHNMKGQIPFEETVNLDGLTETDDVFCSYDLEDCQIQLIHSRKISVRAIAGFHCRCEEEASDPAGIDILSDEAVRTGMESLSPDGLHKQFDTIVYTRSTPRTRDVFRIKDEINLPKGKPNIDTILYYEMTPQNLQTRLLEDSVRITGDLHVFVLYVPVDEERRMEYLETECSIDSLVSCSGCNEQMIPDISFQPQCGTMEAKPDEDGEQRILELELPVNITMKFYEDVELSILSDAYSTACELTLSRQPVHFERLLLKTQNVIRVSEQIKADENQDKILQICTASGRVQIDEQEIQENGIALEGVVELDILYVTENDDRPLGSLRAAIPFQHFMEIKGISPKDHYLLQTDINQISVIMLDAAEIEAKAVLSIGAIVFTPAECQVVCEITEAPQDLERLQKMPGIVGFIVSDNVSLWDIAKEYQTSTESIMALNGLTSEEVHPGDRLLLAKQVDGL